PQEVPPLASCRWVEEQMGLHDATSSREAHMVPPVTNGANWRNRLSGASGNPQRPKLVCAWCAARARASFVRACGRPSPGFFVTLSGAATVVGVGFFDFDHGQRGVAPNAIELHPVLAFSSKSCSQAP